MLHLRHELGLVSIVYTTDVYDVPSAGANDHTLLAFKQHHGYVFHKKLYCWYLSAPMCNLHGAVSRFE